jgi:hypothetical protein
MYGTAKLLQIFLIGYNSLACMHVWRMYDSLLKPDSPIQKINDFSGTLFAYPVKDYSPNIPILYGDLSATDSVWYDTSLHVVSTDFTPLVLYNIYCRLFPTILVTNIIIILFGCYRSILDILEKED